MSTQAAVDAVADRSAVRSGVTSRGDDDPMVAAMKSGDEPAFALLVERHAGELRVHCSRMLRSRSEAEDVVQETFLRAWRRRATFEGRSSLRTWLYSIATNACVDEMRRRSGRGGGRSLVDVDHVGHDHSHGRRARRTGHAGWVADGGVGIGGGVGVGVVVGVGGGDAGGHMGMEPVAAEEHEPEVRVVARQTFEGSLLPHLHDLPPRQRAVVVLRDGFGWSAADTATLLDTTVAATNSALQRARATLRSH
jgi:RNA polymerase sigma-70 factor (ECF subfamily)